MFCFSVNGEKYTALFITFMSIVRQSMIESNAAKQCNTIPNVAKTLMQLGLSCESFQLIV